MCEILYIDKPKGITSFDVCFKLRKVFNTKKIGHTGTLDPNATGLMICLVNNAAKANQFLVSAKKEYVATVKLGIKTDSEDIDGNVILTREETMPRKEDLIKVLNSFLGKSLQVPPITSAIKVNGKKLYEYQRNNEYVEIKPREVEIYEIELLNIDNEYFSFRCLVSSGTYIRSLVRDMLAKFDIIGTLSDLRRTKIDDVSIENANSLGDVLSGNYKSHSIYEVLSKYYYVYEVNNRRHIVDGKPLKLDLDVEYILCVKDKEALAIYKKDGAMYYCVRGLL